MNLAMEFGRSSDWRERAAVMRSRCAEVLETITAEPVQIALWLRSPPRELLDWMRGLRPEQLPQLQLLAAPEELGPALEQACEAAGMPGGLPRKLLLADMVQLARRLVDLSGCPCLRLGLERQQAEGGASSPTRSRWHREPGSLRLLCSYQGPGCEWVPPQHADRALARPYGEAPQALRSTAFEVALFKGASWPGAPDGGLVHRAPRLRGPLACRWLLSLQPAPRGRG